MFAKQTSGTCGDYTDYSPQLRKVDNKSRKVDNASTKGVFFDLFGGFSTSERYTTMNFPQKIYKILYRNSEFANNEYMTFQRFGRNISYFHPCTPARAAGPATMAPVLRTQV